MNENFKYYKLSTKHKKRFILHQALLFITVALVIFIAVKVTNPNIIDKGDQVSLTFGALLGVFVIVLAFTNRLKNLIKVRFVAFLIIFILLFSMQMVITTLVWTFGLALIPLMIDDLILIPAWNRVWYNVYD